MEAQLNATIQKELDEFLNTNFIEEQQKEQVVEQCEEIYNPAAGRKMTLPTCPPRKAQLFDFSVAFSGKFEDLRRTLKKASVAELRAFEKANPSMMEKTETFWQIFCTKKATPEEGETWRDAFQRAESESEDRLKAITARLKLGEKRKTEGSMKAFAIEDLPTKPASLPVAAPPPVTIVAPHKQKRRAQKRPQESSGPVAKRVRSNSEPEKPTVVKAGVKKGFLMKKVAKMVSRRR
ncbi:hypothetical protein QR680_010805 [Steinernema hermaphroditum]|uniref:Uncharacterized protein n=1 Tax=Steinernema hermaphroditum TaxID=289476 RepID=A0AA39IQ62_9BILA|nr:hypothetical protein QR680_010805 [Steinernema hermaphroditum]